MAALCIIALIVVLYYGYQWYQGMGVTQGFMPTQTMRMQQNDNLLIGSSEHQTSSTVTPSAAAPTATTASTAAAPTSFFQQAVQSSTQGTLNYDPNAAAGAPGSLGYMVLNSPDFACATRTPVTDNAWSWMTAVAESGSSSTASTASTTTSESMKGGVKSDNQLSALLAGH